MIMDYGGIPVASMFATDEAKKEWKKKTWGAFEGLHNIIL